jgi:hypothetical protein
MANLLILPGLVTKIGTTRDKSFVITFETQDKGTLADSQKAQIVDLLDEYVTAGFKPTAEGSTDPELLDVPDIKQEFKGDKTPSQRLRAVLYVLWEQQKVSEDFEAYYRRQIEKIIDSIKSKLT